MRIWLPLVLGLTGLCCAEPGAPFERTERTLVVGQVEQVLQAGPYTYVRVGDGKMPFWVATLHQEPRLGDRVQVTVVGRRKDFHSQRLNRTFGQLAFGMVQNASEAGYEHR